MPAWPPRDEEKNEEKDAAAKPGGERPPRRARGPRRDPLRGVGPEAAAQPGALRRLRRREPVPDRASRRRGARARDDGLALAPGPEDAAARLDHLSALAAGPGIRRPLRRSAPCCDRAPGGALPPRHGTRLPPRDPDLPALRRREGAAVFADPGQRRPHRRRALRIGAGPLLRDVAAVHGGSRVRGLARRRPVRGRGGNGAVLARDAPLRGPRGTPRRARVPDALPARTRDRRGAAGARDRPPRPRRGRARRGRRSLLRAPSARGGGRVSRDVPHVPTRDAPRPRRVPRAAGARPVPDVRADGGEALPRLAPRAHRRPRRLVRSGERVLLRPVDGPRRLRAVPRPRPRVRRAREGRGALVRARVARGSSGLRVGPLRASPDASRAPHARRLLAEVRLLVAARADAPLPHGSGARLAADTGGSPAPRRRRRPRGALSLERRRGNPLHARAARLHAEGAEGGGRLPVRAPRHERARHRRRAARLALHGERPLLDRLRGTPRGPAGLPRPPPDRLRPPAARGEGRLRLGEVAAAAPDRGEAAGTRPAGLHRLSMAGPPRSGGGERVAGGRRCPTCTAAARPRRGGSARSWRRASPTTASASRRPT